MSPEGYKMDDRWIETLGHMTYGLYVLTTFHEGIHNGMIASWVSQVSHEPPLIMVAVHPNRYSHQLIEKSNAFALHLLTKGQKDLLVRFKGPDPEGKFDDIKWTAGQTGCPILQNCAGYMECRVIDRYAPGNHTLFIGEVLEGKLLSEEDPLNTTAYEGYYMGRD